eukprot:gene851-144_t
MSILSSQPSQPLHPATAPSFLQSRMPSSLLDSASQLASSVASVLEAPSAGSSLSLSEAPPIAAATVAPSLSPVPAYLTRQIVAGMYVDLLLLRPCNLKKLPPTEPSDVSLARLVRTELLGIRSFGDWAEAWFIYLGVMAQHHPVKLPQLISYGLLIAAACHEVPGPGWRDYDATFRKSAAGNPTIYWAEASPNLWVTTVLSARSPQPNATRSRPPTSGTPFCLEFNSGICDLLACRFLHHCSTCGANHPRSLCSSTSPSNVRNQRADRRSAPLESSGSPSPKRKHK